MTEHCITVADSGYTVYYTRKPSGLAAILRVTDAQGKLLWSASVAVSQWLAQYSQRICVILMCVDDRAVIAYLEEGAQGRVVYATPLSDLLNGQALSPVESRAYKAAVAAQLKRGFATMLRERDAVPQPMEIVLLTYRRDAIVVGVYEGRRHVHLLTALGLCPAGSMVAFRGAEEGTYNLRRAYTLAVLANGLTPCSRSAEVPEPTKELLLAA